MHLPKVLPHDITDDFQLFLSQGGYVFVVVTVFTQSDKQTAKNITLSFLHSLSSCLKNTVIHCIHGVSVAMENEHKVVRVKEQISFFSLALTFLSLSLPV